MYATRPLNCLLFLSAAILVSTSGLHAADKAGAPKPGEPTDPKARKTFASAQAWERVHNRRAAIDAYRKANRQDGGHCTECLRRGFFKAIDIGDNKLAAEVAREWLQAAAPGPDQATVHYLLGVALQKEAIREKKEAGFTASCEEFKTALRIDPGLNASHYAAGISLAHNHQDDAARAEFAAFVQQERHATAERERACRYLERVDLARATMAPPFSILALDGEHVSMDGLAGKVVLIDFWATWCGPCREALPHIRSIAAKFAGQPFVVLSVSMDSDESKWRDFVAHNGMTWLQYRDGRFDGPLAEGFHVMAIPATFSIDADGVLEDQHVGDADIEGKLKKLIKQAAEMPSRGAPATSGKQPGAGN